MPNDSAPPQQSSGSPLDVVPFLDRCRAVQVEAAELFRNPRLSSEARESLKELRLSLLKTRQLLLGNVPLERE